MRSNFNIAYKIRRSRGRGGVTAASGGDGSPGDRRPPTTMGERNRMEITTSGFRGFLGVADCLLEGFSRSFAFLFWDKNNNG